jgi:hypothetical protein
MSSLQCTLAKALRGHDSLIPSDAVSETGSSASLNMPRPRSISCRQQTTEFAFNFLEDLVRARRDGFGPSGRGGMGCPQLAPLKSV